MKIPYQQLCILLLSISQPVFALTLYNKTGSTIRFNIFKKDFIQQGYNLDPLPKNWGKIAARASKKVKNLDAQTEYIVTFYDVYNYLNNKQFMIKGSTKKLSFTAETHKR